MPSGRKSRSAEVERLRARSAQLFTDLLSAEYPSTQRGKKAAATRAMVSPRTGRPTSFSWFDPEDAAKATALAAELAVVTGAQASVEAGLSSALDLAEERASEDPPALVRQALAMFVTHHKPARRLGKPRSVITRPEAFRPSRRSARQAARPAAVPSRRAGVARRGHSARRPKPSSTTGARTLWPTSTTSTGTRCTRSPGCSQPTGMIGRRRRTAEGWPRCSRRSSRGLANQWLTFVQSRPAAEIANAFLSRANALAQQGRFGQFLAAVDGRAVPRPAAAERSPGRAVHLHAPSDARPVRRRAPVGRAAACAPVRTAVHVDPTRRLRPSTAAELPASSVPAKARRDILHAVGATAARAGGRRRGAAVRRDEACRGAHRPHQPRRGTRGRRPALACATARRTLRRSAQHRARSHRRHLGADEPRRPASAP